MKHKVDAVKAVFEKHNAWPVTGKGGTAATDALFGDLAALSQPADAQDGWNSDMNAAPFSRPVQVTQDGVVFSAKRHMPRMLQAIGGEWVAWANGLLCRDPNGSYMLVNPTHWRMHPTAPTAARGDRT